MRRRQLSPRLAELGHVNVVPMIDVVMCLIVFYLIVGKLAADQRSNIRLPVSTTGIEDKAQDHLVINVVPVAGAEVGQSRVRIVIDQREVLESDLERTIKDRLGARPGVVVELRGARDLSYGAVAAVIRAAKNAGVESIRLATEKP